MFKLIKEEFNQNYQEWQWTYNWLTEFTLNGKVIKKITITDHWLKKSGREDITKEVILNILWKNLNSQEVPVIKKYGVREILVAEYIKYNSKYYRIIFWFKDNCSDHLWIRNCYRID